MRGMFIASGLALLILIGCAGAKVGEEKSAQELIQEGMNFFDNGKYTKAIDSFERLRDWYPFSKYAGLAELKIADSHFNMDSYAEAILAYEEFERLHPRNEAVPYVIYRIGRSYFNQIDTIDRDQSSAEKAIETFQRLIRQHPDDAYATMARSEMVECYKTLSGHQFYVGVFYYKQKNYKAAKKRFVDLIQKYPDVGYHYKALMYLANCDAWLMANVRVPQAPSAPGVP